MAIVALNLKTYEESFQKTKLLEAVAEQETEHELIVCPSLPDSPAFAAEGKEVRLFAQHVDPNGFGAFTGSVPWSAMKRLGFEGSLLNHSEKKIPHNRIRETIENAKEFKIIACADTIEEAKILASFAPWAVAIEPPELIGSGVSVSKAKPEIVKEGVKAIKKANRNVKALVGAGVSTREDFRKSLELGAEGVLLASAFVKAKDPKKWLEEFLEA
ncbi:triose-phosphate isomerase [Candidatus Micrarchaeota archaeon]|nr:triose-phosphate isomerase [Candidatus Micrarchaeota archaeon]